MANRNHPDLILMDFQLPGKDGRAAIKMLKGNTGISTLSVVALTAQAVVGDREKAQADGCNGYIAKPIDTSHFLKVVALFFGFCKVFLILERVFPRGLVDCSKNEHEEKGFWKWILF